MHRVDNLEIRRVERHREDKPDSAPLECGSAQPGSRNTPGLWVDFEINCGQRVLWRRLARSFVLPSRRGRSFGQDGHLAEEFGDALFPRIGRGVFSGVGHEFGLDVLWPGFGSVSWTRRGPSAIIKPRHLRALSLQPCAMANSAALVFLEHRSCTEACEIAYVQRVGQC